MEETNPNNNNRTTDLEESGTINEEGLFNLPEEVSPDQQLANTLNEVNQIIESGQIPGSSEELEGMGEEPQEEVEMPAESELESSTEESEELEDNNQESLEEETEEASKMVSMTLGEERLEVPEDAELEVIVDGEPTKVKLSEFRNNISGQLAINKRFSALDVQKKEIEKRHNEWNRGEMQVREMLSEGKAKETLDFILESAGIPQESFYAQLTEQIAPEVEQFLRLSPQERIRRSQQIKEDRYQKQLEATRRDKERLQAKMEQSDRVRRVQQNLGLDDASFVAAYDALMGDIVSGNIQMQAEAVTPETVGEYVQFTRFEDSAIKALKQVAPHVADNHRVVHEFVREGKRLSDQGYTMDDSAFLELASQVYKGAPQTRQAKAKEGPKSRTTKQSKGLSSKQDHWMNQMLDEMNQTHGSVNDVTKKWGNR